MEKRECLRCGWEWIPRIEKISSCPRCKNRNWDLPMEGKCSICNKNYLKLYIHHIDGNHNNNKKENRILICQYCHLAIHRGFGSKSNRRGKTRKYGEYTTTGKLSKYTIKSKDIFEIRKKIKDYQNLLYQGQNGRPKANKNN